MRAQRSTTDNRMNGLYDSFVFYQVDRLDCNKAKKEETKLRKMSKTPNATLLNLSKKVHTPTVFVFCIDFPWQGCWSRSGGGDHAPILPILTDQLN